MSTREHLLGPYLRSLGITHVCGIAAQPVYGAFSSCAAAGLSLISTRDQRPAVLVASSMNYLAGKQIACVLATPGPALTNTYTGALVARDNGWPVIIIGVSVRQTEGYSGGFQELDIVDSMRSVTKHAVEVSSNYRFADALEFAYREAQAGTPGPVYVDIPVSLLLGQIDSNERGSLEHVERGTVMPCHSDIEQLALKLKLAPRPLFLLSSGIRWGNAWTSIRKLIEQYDIPFVAGSGARGFISERHDLCMTRASRSAQSQASHVVLFGGEFDWIFRFGATINSDAELTQVNTTLNSDVPTKKKMHKIYADSEGVASELLRTLGSCSPSKRERRDDQWILKLQHEVRSSYEAWDSRIADSPELITVYHLAAALKSCISPSMLVITDANVSMRAAELIFDPVEPLSYLNAGQNGYMGGGIPYAVASLLQEPDRPVVVLSGDFAFGQSAMEIETAARFNLPLVVILSNNNSVSSGISDCPEFDRTFVNYVEHIRYDLFSRAVGGQGDTVSDVNMLPSAIRKAFETAWRDRCPYILNVHVAKEEIMPPRI